MPSLISLSSCPLSSANLSRAVCVLSIFSVIPDRISSFCIP